MGHTEAGNYWMNFTLINVELHLEIQITELFCLMGAAALRPLEQENDLKEGLINTSYMIQGARDRMLK